MLLKLSVIFMFAGIVTLLAVLRSDEQRPLIELESRFSAWEQRLAALVEAGEPGSTLILIAIARLQSLAFHCLVQSDKALSSDSGSAQIETEVQKIEAQFIAVKQGQGFSAEPIESVFLEWQRRCIALRQQHRNQWLPEHALQAVEAKELGASSSETIDLSRTHGANLDKAEEDALWRALEPCVRDINSLRMAFSEPEKILPLYRKQLDAFHFLFQSMTPKLLVCLALDSGLERVRVEHWLQSLAQDFGQQLLAAHTCQRLAKTQLAESLLDSLLKSLEQLLALTDSSLESAWEYAKQPSEGFFIEWAVYEKFGEELRRQTERSMAQVPTDKDLLVIEMLLAHPRGRVVLEAFELKCVGCLLVDSETLTDACHVHNVSLEEVLATLRNEAQEAAVA